MQTPAELAAPSPASARRSYIRLDMTEVAEVRVPSTLRVLPHFVALASAILLCNPWLSSLCSASATSDQAPMFPLAGAGPIKARAAAPSGRRPARRGAAALRRRLPLLLDLLLRRVAFHGAPLCMSRHSPPPCHSPNTGLGSPRAPRHKTTPAPSNAGAARAGCCRGRHHTGSVLGGGARRVADAQRPPVSLHLCRVSEQTLRPHR